MFEEQNSDEIQLEEKIEKLINVYLETKEKLEALTDHNKHLEANYQALQTTLTEKAEELSNLQEVLKEKNETIAMLEEEIDILEKKVEQKETKITTSASKIDAVLSKVPGF